MRKEQYKKNSEILKKYGKVINQRLENIGLIDSGIVRDELVQKKFKKTFLNDKALSPHGEIVGQCISLYASKDCSFYSFLAKGNYLDVISKLYEAINRGINLINISMDTVINVHTKDGLNIYKKWKDAVDYAESKNITIVCSAGNNGLNLDEIYPYMVLPAMFKNVITIGSLNSNYEKAKYSNFGTYVNEFLYGGDELSKIQFKMYDDTVINTFGTSISAGLFSGIVSNIK